MVLATKEKKGEQLAPPEPTRKEIILPELERIRQNGGGILTAEDVVEEAADEDSPLHPYFQWDETKAAHEYRLWQARQIISAMVVVLPTQKRSVFAYVSMRADRQHPAGGYMAMVEVLSNATLRQRLLNEALADLLTWEKKFHRLAELAEVFEAISSVKKKVSKKK